MTDAIGEELSGNCQELLWQRLIIALRQQRLPSADGGTVRCYASDFMLMGQGADGVTHFKCVITRNYVHLSRDGVLRIPTGGAFHGATFESSVTERSSSRNPPNAT